MDSNKRPLNAGLLMCKISKLKFNLFNLEAECCFNHDSVS